MTISIARYRTAIGRGGNLSRPVQTALEAEILRGEKSFFDYGCGRGEDISILTEMGVECAGWDPAYRPDSEIKNADIVNIGYVINVIENESERSDTLRQAWDLAEQLLIVSARMNFDQKSKLGHAFADGCITATQTFQKFFRQTELREWIAATLGAEPIAAAPGIFFVFRDRELRQDYLSRRYRRHRAAPRISKSELLYEEHRELLDTLAKFVADRARLPEIWEISEYANLTDTFGSVKRAFAVIRRVTGSEQWDAIRIERTGELMIQFALDRFTGRPRFSELPRDVQLDVRKFFSSYKNACKQADDLLFQAGDMEVVGEAMLDSIVGKRTGNALYVHVDAMHQLPQILRVYEGCAKAYIGDLVEANIIKLHRNSPRVSYLTYPDFDNDPHPTLEETFLVKMGALEVFYRSYINHKNPPILHRKEEMISRDDQRWGSFRRLTEQEERWGLYDESERIGTRHGWEKVLAEKGASFRGRRLVRVKKPLSGEESD